MFIGFRKLQDGTHMHPALVGKCAFSHKWPLILRGDIGNFAHKPREFRQLPHALFRNASGTQFKMKIPHNTYEIHISTAFSIAVYGTLHHTCPPLNRHQGICQRQTAVIMCVDSQLCLMAGSDLFHDGAHLMGHATAIGIAQHDKISAPRFSGPDGFKGVFGIILVSVKKMFRIENNLAVLLFQVCYRVFDHE